MDEKGLYGNIVWHIEPLKMYWHKNAHGTPFRPVSHETWFLDCHKYCPKQNIDFVHFLCTNILNWPSTSKAKTKALPCQNTDRTHWSNGIAERSKSKSKLCMQQSEAGIANTPMANRHCQNDSTLAQWCCRALECDQFGRTCDLISQWCDQKNLRLHWFFSQKKKKVSATLKVSLWFNNRHTLGPYRGLN